MLFACFLDLLFGCYGSLLMVIVFVLFWLFDLEFALFWFIDDFKFLV